MSQAVPAAADLVSRYGGKDIADVAVPADQVPLTAAQMEAAARGEDLSAWPTDVIEAATQALARIDAAIGRAGTELAFYLRFRDAGVVTPPWLPDDVQELARYHLYDRAGNKDSTVRLRYDDVIRRLKALMDEDAQRASSGGQVEGGTSTGIVVSRSEPRMFSRRSLGRL